MISESALRVLMCGMGRCGTLYACEWDGIAPDIVALAKGLGAGYQPIGAMVVSRKIWQAIHDGSGFLAHGHTYVAHTTACAGALAVQKVIQEENLPLPAAVRARLAKEQADRIALQNAITRRELVPAAVLVELVSGIAAQVGVILEALPGKIRREVPDLPAIALDAVARELAKGRNALVDMKIEAVLDEAPVAQIQSADLIDV